MANPEMILVIGDKNLSSWSMRPWLAMRAAGVPFKEVKILLDQRNTAEKIKQYSPSGRVPLLLHGEHRIWDSLAICEYLAETYKNHSLWPADKGDRAFARSMVAEMHSSFQSLRSQLSMDIRLRTQIRHLTSATEHDISRITQLWGDCLKKTSGPFLFGDFGIVDAFYAPVVFRFISYGIKIKNKKIVQYMKSVSNHPAVKEWVKEARKEKPVLRAY